MSTLPTEHTPPQVGVYIVTYLGLATECLCSLHFSSVASISCLLGPFVVSLSPLPLLVTKYSSEFLHGWPCDQGTTLRGDCSWKIFNTCLQKADHMGCEQECGLGMAFVTIREVPRRYHPSWVLNENLQVEPLVVRVVSVAFWPLCRASASSSARSPDSACSHRDWELNVQESDVVTHTFNPRTLKVEAGWW